LGVRLPEDKTNEGKIDSDLEGDLEKHKIMEKGKAASKKK